MLRRKSALGRVAFVAFAAVAGASCAPSIALNGNRPHPDLVAGIQPGVHTKNGVAEILGAPSSLSTFNGDVWYYISDRREQVAFLDPTVLDRQVIAILFDEEGVVKEMKVYTEESSRDVDIVGRKTPTAGNELTVFEQFIGNIGKFNRPQGPAQ